MIALDERPLYLREILATLQSTIAPELSSDHAKDALDCIERVLAHLVIASELGNDLEGEFSARVNTELTESLPFSLALSKAQSRGISGQLSTAHIHSLAEAERHYLQGLAAARNHLLHPLRQSQNQPQACSITAAQLTAYLRERLPGLADLTVASLVLLPGGRSKETLLVDLGDAGHLTGVRVMRKDVAIGLNATRTSDEYATLTLAARAGIPVPQPLLVEADPDRLGGTFMIVSRVAGEKQGEIFPDVAFPTEGKAEIGAQLAEILANIHQIPIQETGLPVPDPNQIKASLLARIDAAAARFSAATQGEPSALFGIAIHWLRRTIDDALQGPIVLRHGDLGLHNVLIDGTTITAILDWELSELGYAAADLGSLRHSVKALMPWRDFVDRYVAAGGKREAANDKSVRFFAVLGKISGMANTQLASDMFRTGAKRSIVTANSAADFRYRLAILLADELSGALAELAPLP
jgi:aminoglycoside phosphotransferase (APT) family kinase protein